jgi:hypothetical protein
MKYEAKIRTIGKVSQIEYVIVEADSGDEAEQLIKDGLYDTIDSYEVDYYDGEVDEILEIEPTHETD